MTRVVDQERARELAFTRYVREAAGAELAELEPAELEALRTIYKWGTGPTQIARRPGESFADVVQRVRLAVPYDDDPPSPQDRRARERGSQAP